MSGWGVHPFHLALTVSSGTVAVTNLFSHGIILVGAVGDYVGVVAGVAAIVLFAGWVLRRPGLTEWGLLLAAGAWTSRAMFAFLTSSDPWPTMLLSSAWAVGAAGAYIMERRDHKWLVADE